MTFEERNRQPVFPFVDGELGNPLSFAAWVQGDEPLGCRPTTWPPIAVPYLIGASAAEQRSGARRVRHAKFGPGVVIRAFDDGDDAKLEILFDRGETKTLIAKFVSDEPPIRARPR